MCDGSLLFYTAATPSSSGDDTGDNKTTVEEATVNSSKVSSSLYCSHVICSVYYLGYGQSSTSW